MNSSFHSSSNQIQRPMRDCETFASSPSTNKLPAWQKLSAGTRSGSWEESESSRSRRHSYSGDETMSTNSPAGGSCSTTNRRGAMVRSRSLSHSKLAAQSCACFAPLPDYAKYQERKIMRALSRNSIFAETPVSPHHNRQARPTISMEDLGFNSSRARHPTSPDSVVDSLTSPGRSSHSRIYVRSQSDSSIQSTPQKFPSLPIPVDMDTPVTEPKQKRHSTDVNSHHFAIIDDPPPFTTTMATAHQQPSCAAPPSYEECTSGSKTATTATRVEISPGVTAILRSKDETMEAIRNDFFLPVACFGCSLDLFCIADAQYVICPQCRVVSPLLETVMEHEQEGDETHEQKHSKRGGGGGLGLGVSFESLVAIQRQIVASRIQMAA